VTVHRQAVVRVLLDPMVPFPAEPVRIHVHCHAAETRQVMEDLVADLGGDPVPLPHGQRAGDGDAHLGVEAMTDPPRSDIAYFLHAWHVSRRVRDLVEGLGLHAIEDA
jgi:hypothetical protein